MKLLPLETSAALLTQRLREQFPRVSFSVHLVPDHVGSLVVHWYDGPASTRVAEVVKGHTHPSTVTIDGETYHHAAVQAYTYRHLTPAGAKLFEAAIVVGTGQEYDPTRMVLAEVVSGSVRPVHRVEHRKCMDQLFRELLEKADLP